MPQIETFHREGRTAGEDLVKSAREGWPATDMRTRIIVTDGMDMEAQDGVHRIDILPDYRLQLNAPSPKERARHGF